ncbi:MAG: hypothetical protein LBQ66_00295 [Planctomycetaceae bacterium]|nr:hypothetical protein [Planctomycetaceae bacterium]
MPSSPKGAEHVLIYQNAQTFGAFWFCRCFLAIRLSAYADVTAWQSVTHLTIGDARWRPSCRLAPT